MHPAATAAEKLAFVLLAATSVLAPIPNGSNTASAAGLIGIAISISLLCAHFASEPETRARSLLGKVLLLAGLLIAWTALQSLLPTASHSEVNELVGTVPTDAIPDAGSIYFQPMQSIGYVLIPLAAFIAALIIIRDDASYLSFIHILLGSSFVVTVACIVEYIVSPGTLLLEPKLYYLNSFTGTFVNANTAATYFGIMLLLSLALCMRQFREVRRHQRMIRTTVSNPRLRNLIIYCVWTTVFSIALLLTRSRAGTISSFLAIIAFAGSYAFTNLRRRVSPMRLIAMSTLAIIIASLVFALLAQRVLLRIEYEGLVDQLRLCAYESTWRAILDNFWLGTGLGSFQDIFPAYRSPECSLSGYWEMAHSVYLEAWLSLGVLFIPVLAMIFYHLVKTYAHGYRSRRRFRFVPLVSLGVLLLLSLHSLVDFSLQIPAISVVAALVLGAGAAVSLAPQAISQDKSDIPSRVD